MNRRCRRISIDHGFTLVELLVALAITGLVLTGIYTSYRYQQQMHITQQQVIEMQQNLRAVMYLMSRDIRMAGLDPGNGNQKIGPVNSARDGGAGFWIAEPGLIHLTKDEEGDGDLDDPHERIAFGFTATDDPERDGLTNSSRGASSLGKKSGNQPGFLGIADTIHAVGFAYAFDANGDDDLDTTPTNGNVIWAIDTDADGWLDTHLDTNDDGIIDSDDAAGGTGFANPVFVTDIRAVKIWVLARTENVINGHTDNTTYVVGDKHVVVNDHFRRQLMVSMVTCRNMYIENENS